jgi:hypothetical protein
MKVFRHYCSPHMMTLILGGSRVLDQPAAGFYRMVLALMDPGRVGASALNTQYNVYHARLRISSRQLEKKSNCLL